MKKLVFLNPCNYNSPSNQSHAPLSFGYISSYLQQHTDEEFDISIEVDVNRVLAKKPDIVGIASYTESYMDAIAAAKKIKHELKNTLVLLGGKHITALPKNLNKAFDIGVYGEGEQTTTELISLYLKNQLHHEYLKDVAGIVYYNENEKVVTRGRIEIPSLDMLPKPRRDIMHAWFPSVGREWYWPQAIYTSRGCPYVCHFCVHSTIKSKTRFHSAERVIEELEDIIRHYPNQKNITIYDDLFVIDKKKVKKISDLIVQEKIHKKVSFTCMGKADIFDEEFCHMLKKMNVKLMSFGFESGNDKILKYLKTDRSKVSDNQRVIELCDKFGIAVGGYFIVGAPQETLDELGQTYWFIRKNTPPVSMFGAFSLTPFPGTSFWSEAVARKEVHEDMEDWSKFSYIDFIEGKSFFFNENYSVEDFKRAYESFYNLSPKNSVFILNNKDEEDLAYSEYISGLLKKNLEIKKDIKVLEIGNNYHYSFSYLTETGIEQVQNLNSWIFRQKSIDYAFEIKNRLQDKKFDLIFFNYSLEQMLKPEEFLKEITKYLISDGKILFLMKNTANIYELAGLLLGNQHSTSNFGFRKFDILKETGPEAIKDELARLGLKQDFCYPIKNDTSNLSYIYKSVLPLFQGVSKQEIISELDTGSFVMLFSAS